MSSMLRKSYSIGAYVEVDVVVTTVITIDAEGERVS